MNRTNVYRAPVADLVRTVQDADDNPVEIQPAEGAIVDGRLYVLRIEGQHAYIHATPKYAAREGWTVVADGHAEDENGKRIGWEWADLPAPHAMKLLRANVYRRKDGGSLRAELATAAGTTLPPNVPVTGRWSGAPPDPPKALRALEMAREMAHDNDVPAVAVRLSVSMDRVHPGDLVEDDTAPPHEWM